MYRTAQLQQSCTGRKLCLCVPASNSPKHRYLWPLSRAKQHDLIAPSRTHLLNGSSLLNYHAPPNNSNAIKEEQIIVHVIPLLRNLKCCLTLVHITRKRHVSSASERLAVRLNHKSLSSALLWPPIASIMRTLPHAVALIASSRRILNLSNIPTRPRLRHELITREHTKPKPTTLLLSLRVLVEQLAKRSAVDLSFVLISRRPANENRSSAVLVVLARLAASGSVFVRALVFDAAGAGAVVRDTIQGRSAPALACDTVGADEVGSRTFGRLGDG